MKKTATAMVMIALTLVLIGTVFGQERQRPTRQIGNPIGLGGTVTAGIKNRAQGNFRKRIDKATPLTNLGDTATHEVGHKGKRRSSQFRPNPTGDGTTEQFRQKGAGQKAQNLLPYLEQDNVYKKTPVNKQRRRKSTTTAKGGGLK